MQKPFSLTELQGFAPKLKNHHLQKFAELIQYHYESGKITLSEADDLFNLMPIPSKWRMNVNHRRDRRSIATFLAEQNSTTKVQRIFIDEYLRKCGKDYVIKDNGCGNNGVWIIDPKMVSKAPDYILIKNNLKFKIEVKWIRAFGFITPKVEDLEAAINDKVDFTFYFFSHITPTKDYISPNTKIGIMPLSVIPEILKLNQGIYVSCKTGIPIYGEKGAIRLYLNDKPNIEDYFPLYNLADGNFGGL